MNPGLALIESTASTTAPHEPAATGWRFYLNPREAWEAMYQDCEAARESIEFEQFIIENDRLGRRFMELFIRKARQGVRVFVLCDRFGSRRLTRSPLVKALRQAGGELRFYRPFNPINPWSWFPRTHVKTMLIDRTIGYAGGVCYAKRMQHWRDTQVRLTGDAVEQICRSFDDLRPGAARHLPAVSHRSRDIVYLQHHPELSFFPIYYNLLQAIEASRRSIDIATAFFVPSRRFLRRLKRAAASGVEVRVLVPERSDRLLADWMCLSYARELLGSGVRLFHYRPSVLHCKIMLVDDVWASIGSTNMDVVSFLHNREANILTTNLGMIAEMKAQFERDLASSREITASVLGRLPRYRQWVGYGLRAFKLLM